MPAALQESSGGAFIMRDFWEEHYFFDANFQRKVIADWESSSTHSHLHHRAQRLWGGRWEGGGSVSLEPLFYELSLWLSPLIWRADRSSGGGRKSELVREEKKEGEVSLAGDWESSSAWRQRAKPGALLRPARRISELNGRLRLGHNRMWLERRNERRKWVFDTVETLTLHQRSVRRYRGRLPDKWIWYSLPHHYCVSWRTAGATEWCFIVCSNSCWNPAKETLTNLGNSCTT